MAARRSEGRSVGALVPGVAGAALLVVMFALPWFGAGEALERGFDEAREIQQQFGGPEVVIPDVDENAWQALGIVELVLVAAGLSGIVLTLVELVPRPPVSRLGTAGVTTGAGILATAVVLYHLVNPPGDESREIGIYVGLLAAAGVALGGWVALDREEQRSRRGGGEARSAREPLRDAPRDP